MCLSLAWLLGALAVAPRSAAQDAPADAVHDGPVVLEADPFTTGASGAAPLAPGQIELTTVSTRPSLVTGDDVRVAVRGLQSDDVLTVTRDGTDVTSAFG